MAIVNGNRSKRADVDTADALIGADYRYTRDFAGGTEEQSHRVEIENAIALRIVQDRC